LPLRPVKRYHVTTFGCQMNEHDSERMKGMLESLGYSEAPDRDRADLILFNTCSIREKADNRLIGHLGEAKRLKQEDPTKVVGVGGCWAQSVKDQKPTFAELLGMIDAVDGVERIRYTSPHPKDMREDVIRAHAELPALCEHIHLPLQSGSSRILKAMKRTYNRERYMDRVALIREHVPDCSLTTDIIVGFPGETEADFEETIEVAEEVGYDSAFTFIFSPRRGTAAAEYDDQVPHDVQRERMERL